MEPHNSFGKRLFLLILFSALIRGVVASLLELGNDEVYYWTYALFPDLSHFDHPPMVGWVISLFSFNLSFQTEFFIRLSAIILGSINIYLIYSIGKMLLDQLTGWYAAVLYTSSIYASILTGIFILPDTPQMFYWLLSIYFLLLAMNDQLSLRFRNFQWTMAGMAIGLALLSKYTSAFLWAGTGLYILFFRRSTFRNPFLYLSFLISIAIFSPVIIWNVQNDFISLTFHSGRIGIDERGIQWDYFFREIFGQFFYNNPFNVVITGITLVMIFKSKKLLYNPSMMMLLMISLPIILLFLLFSLFKSTLPHWSGPAYVTLLIPAAIVIRQLHEENTKFFRRIRRVIYAGMFFLMFIVILGVLQVRMGLLYNGKETEIQKLGKDDVSLDMYGWDQVSDAFTLIKEHDKTNSVFKSEPVLFSYRWFPAANIDYYVARTNKMQVFAIGNLERIHKYAWINQARGGLQQGMNGYFITTSRDFANPQEIFKEYFERIEPIDPIPITRNGKTVEYLFIYRLFNLQSIPGQLPFAPSPSLPQLGEGDRVGAAAYRPSIFLGSTHSSNCSEVTRPSSNAASFKVLFSE